MFVRQEVSISGLWFCL